MRKAEKRQAEEFVRMLDQAHEEIRGYIEKGRMDGARDLLGQCQEGAIRLGELIEIREGEQFVTIPLLEAYCEVVYQVHEELGTNASINANNAYKKLRKALVQVSNSVRNDIKVRPEIVFLPYKASMWDSLESIWMAADADPECDAYVVPIPYYDKNPDGSLGKMHYEGASLPEYVPVTHYNDYSIEDSRPDAIYIHNPYDDLNYVTSVDPRYYSNELKKYTEKLVYVPYYSSSGGTSEGQAFCPAYLNADYIVVQAEKFKGFFDSRIPRKKLLALGSPKFDRTIRLCQNPPEPPAEWKEKMVHADGTRKKVYFYNTSINGMLADTKRFLMKMEYVFNVFQGREDACLLWRPHPLLESTFDSMRPHLKTVYGQLKERFFQQKLGIYDDTPDIEKTIALCDAYIGDSATSVTSLFGIAGKPLFIFNNNINTLPEEDDWRGEIIKGFLPEDTDQWIITQGNKLYHSPERNYCYRYYCDLSLYSYGSYYSRAIEIEGKVYVCPFNAQDILVIAGGKIEKTVALKNLAEYGAFIGAWSIGRYILLLPGNYPYAVKYDTTSGRIDYIEGCQEIFRADVNGERRYGGHCVWKNYFLLASPVDNRVIAIDSNSGKIQVMNTRAKKARGCWAMVRYQEEVWLLPLEGDVITRWNPETGEVREYSGLPEGFECIHSVHGYVCKEYPFSRMAFDRDYAYLSPMWGNMFVRLERNTGKMEEWIPPFPVPSKEKNGYYISYSKGSFIEHKNEAGEYCFTYYSGIDRKLYTVKPGENACREIPILFDREELKAHEPGFCEESDWLQYAVVENAFNSLQDFLDGKITGGFFDRERQVKAFGTIAANYDGTSGEKIHRYVQGKL